MPTKDYPSEKFVRSLIYLPYARIAVFEYPQILGNGQASWYAYKKGNYAASPDFPKGSRLRIFNSLKPEKFVDVEINDYGPNRDIHPDRVVDLEKTAFSKIASLGEGTVKINILPLYIAPVDGKVLGVPAKGLVPGLNINSPSAVILNANSGKIIWAKNSTTSLPIASLTKMVSAKVFLDTNPNFKEVVSYKTADEEYNYKYANKWEIARLKVADGETMTIEDLFYSALVGSANNAVESLVRVSGLTRDEFIARMNQAAKEIGANSANFVEPTGLAPENISSAQDYALISSKVLANPIIEKASKTRTYNFTTINTKIPHYIKNTNPLISSNGIKVTGSKTGYLHEAKYCLMTKAENENNKVIVVTLGTPTRTESFSETKELIDFGLSNIQ
ncbi:MAG: D-alanyl-D-alanine endopeptidase, penicillin-binding protein 7 and penicillin-binding protein 8 [Parcubacteria group bacterium GW2011_GWE2_38_18]|nr:MAG: D-alanyl-D-alanine endopeptidase, penicillin-binding protein 7 and penicillin-binding protein 8 [Parcubacteria group bacterium GW2011_GWE2_38_18]